MNTKEIEQAVNAGMDLFNPQKIQLPYSPGMFFLHVLIQGLHSGQLAVVETAQTPFGQAQVKEPEDDRADNNGHPEG